MIWGKLQNFQQISSYGQQSWMLVFYLVELVRLLNACTEKNCNVILIASIWIQNVISVYRINSRLTNIWIIMDKSIFSIFRVYVLGTDCPLERKNLFNDQLLSELVLILENKILLVSRYFNFHVRSIQKSLIMLSEIKVLVFIIQKILIF